MNAKFFNNINVGITSKCNAKCYLCNRRCIEGFPLNVEMSPSIFDKLIPYTKKIQIIGGFGDFINHSKSLEIVDKLKDINFLIETNGELHDTQYWKQLAKLANNANQCVQFSIDDIENEVNPYRKVNTENVLRNLDVFVEAGGFAKIKTLLFNFNENQIIDMKNRFKDLEFYTQQSMFYPKTGLLSAPSYISHAGSISLLNTIAEQKMKSPNACPWQEGKWLLINELGEVHTCCYILTFITGLKDKAPTQISKYTSLKYYNEVHSLYIKNKELIDLNNVSLEEAYNNEYNDYVRSNFKNIKRCKISCGINERLKNALQGVKYENNLC